MASWRIRFHDKWPHLASLYASTHQLDEEGKHPDPMMGQDNVFDPSEPYNAYRYYIQPVARSEFSIEEPTYVNRPVYKDEESRSSGYTSGDSFQRGSTCRVFLCVFLVLSFIGVVVAAITLAVLLSKTPRPTSSAKIQPEIFESEASLLGREFNDKLLDKESKEFEELSAEVCLALEQMFKDYDSPFRNEFAGCEVVEFRNGSIQAIFRLNLKPLASGAFKDVKKVQQELEKFFAKKLKQTGPWNSVKFNPNFIKKFIRIDQSPPTTTSVTTTTKSPKRTTHFVTTDATQGPTEIKSTISIAKSTQDAQTTVSLTEKFGLTEVIYDKSTESIRKTAQPTEVTEHVTSISQLSEATTVHIQPDQSTETYVYEVTTEKPVNRSTDIPLSETETTEFPLYYDNITDILQHTETTNVSTINETEQSTRSEEQIATASFDQSPIDSTSTQTSDTTTSSKATTLNVKTTSASQEVYPTTAEIADEGVTEITLDKAQTNETAKPEQTTASSIKPSDASFESTSQPTEKTSQSKSHSTPFSVEIQTTEPIQLVSKQSTTTQTYSYDTSSSEPELLQTTQSPNVTGLADLVAETTEFPYYNFTDIVPDLNFTGEYWYIETTEGQVDAEAAASNKSVPLVTTHPMHTTESSVNLTQTHTEASITSTQVSTGQSNISTIVPSDLKLSISKIEVIANDTALNDTISDLITDHTTTDKPTALDNVTTTTLVPEHIIDIETTTILMSPVSTSGNESQITQISQKSFPDSGISSSTLITTGLVEEKSTTSVNELSTPEAKIHEISTATTHFTEYFTSGSSPAITSSEQIISTETPRQGTTSQPKLVSTDQEESSILTHDFETNTSLSDNQTSKLIDTYRTTPLGNINLEEFSTRVPVSVSIDLYDATGISNETNLSDTTPYMTTVDAATQTEALTKSALETLPVSITSSTLPPSDLTTSDFLTKSAQTSPFVISTNFSTISVSSKSMKPVTTSKIDTSSNISDDFTTKKYKAVINDTDVVTVPYETTESYKSTIAVSDLQTSTVSEDLTTVDDVSQSDSIRTYPTTVTVSTHLKSNESTNSETITPQSNTTGSNDTITDTYIYDLITDYHNITTTEMLVKMEETTTIASKTITTEAQQAKERTTSDDFAGIATFASVDLIRTKADVTNIVPITHSFTTEVSKSIPIQHSEAQTTEANITSALLVNMTLDNTTVSDEIILTNDSMANTTKNRIGFITSITTETLNQTLNETATFLNETKEPFIAESNFTEQTITSFKENVTTVLTELGNATDTSVFINETTSNISETLIANISESTTVVKDLNETHANVTDTTYDNTTTKSPVTDTVYQNVTEYYEYYENETYMWYENSTDFYNITDQYIVTDSIMSVTTETPAVLNQTTIIATSNDTSIDVLESTQYQNTTLLLDKTTSNSTGE